MKKYMQWLFLFGGMAMLLAACSKWDEFKKYTDEGEILYTGKLDSVKVYSGKNRVRVTGLLNADPKIRALKIFWNEKSDSAVYEINRGNGNVFDQIINVPEGIRTFVIHTYDSEGNASVPVTVTGVSYGDAYRRKLNNRLITDVLFSPAGATIQWDAMDMSTGAQYTEVAFEVNGDTETVATPVRESATNLEGLVTTTMIRYRTIFKPDSTSIDTFAIPFRDYLIKVVPQLKNRQVPFKASSVSGRWGILADWKSNDNVKIHNGHGGWDEWNGNIFNVESGWGAPPVTNGKIWQTLMLEPGTYTFEISDLRDTNLTDQDHAYLVVAEGDGLPDVGQVQTAIGSAHIVVGKPLNELRVVFTITEVKEVSLGYLTTQPDGNPGRFCNIRAFGFYAN